MKMRSVRFVLSNLLILGFLMARPGYTQTQEPRYFPTAIFAFEERGQDVKGYGEKAADILFARLASQPELFLVERAKLDKILAEQELNLSGVITSTEAVKIGQLIGAKILITGSVFVVEKKLYIVAKIIGTETGRVLGESVNGRPDEFAVNLEALGSKLSDQISRQANTLVAPVQSVEDHVAEINKALGNAKRPVVFVHIVEEHIGPQSVDPAAQTEIVKILRDTGFEVIDSDEGTRKDADLILRGEGFSEFGMRNGNLVSVKARLELKAVDLDTDIVIASDRYDTVAIDLSEQIAGKKALQEAAAALAGRIAPQLIKKSETAQ
ncbi:MAG: CsgG/HfaB family protein [Candidatus Omnitrophota bacterium]